MMSAGRIALTDSSPTSPPTTSELPESWTVGAHAIAARLAPTCATDGGSDPPQRPARPLDRGTDDDNPESVEHELTPRRNPARRPT